MKPYKERLPLIDAAIDALDGDVSNCEIYIDDSVYIVMHIKSEKYYSYHSPFSIVMDSVDYVGTVDEFNQRKADLQNKPSWDDAPEWANWLAQDWDGYWVWFKPKPTPVVNLGYWSRSLALKWSNAQRGTVIGGWLDTLERRPDSIAHSEHQSEQGSLPTECVIKEQNMNYLPPIGSYVDIIEHENLMYGHGETNCEVVGHFEDSAIVRMSYGLGCFRSHVLKPTSTETDKLAEQLQEDILAHWNDNGIDCPIAEWELAKHLYEKGYRKIKPMSEQEFMKKCVDICGHGSTQLYRAGCRFLDGDNDAS